MNKRLGKLLYQIVYWLQTNIHAIVVYIFLSIIGGAVTHIGCNNFWFGFLIITSVLVVVGFFTAIVFGLEILLKKLCEKLKEFNYD